MSKPVRFGRIEVRGAQRQLLIDGQPAALGARAFDLLLALVERRDRLVSKRQLLDLVWPGLVVEENNLQVQISTLRKLLGPQAIATIPGRGYRLALPADDDVPVAPPAAATAPAATPAHGGAPGNLPAALAPLIGRDDDLAAVVALLDGRRVVTVVGAGGIGKSRLAQAAAHALRHRFADGAWMVELAPVTDPALLPNAVAQTLGLSLAGRKSAAEELVDALRGRDLLLVLDNCEHLIESASEFVAALIDGPSQVRVLATSRELLKARDEHVYRVGTLAVPASNVLPAAAGAGAVALFVERASALQPGFVLSEKNAADVVEICRRLDGLPLAIELAAARVPMLGVAGVRERLRERFRLLSGGARAAPRRHQTLRETMDWSHGLLGPEDRAVFRRAGVFVGSFSLPAAQQTLAAGDLDEWAVLDHLGALIDKSLLVADPGEPPRYRLLESTRAYALQKLREAGETDATLRRHALAMRAIFERAFAERWTVSYTERHERWLPEFDNLRAALDWAHAAGEAELEIALAGASHWLWFGAGHLIEGRRRCAQALALIDASTPAELEARLQMGWWSLSLPSVADAPMHAIARAVDLYRDVADQSLLCQALIFWAQALGMRNDLEASEQALQDAERLFDRRWPGALHWQLHSVRSRLAFARGRLAEALVLAEEELAIAREVGDHWFINLSLDLLQQAAAIRGDFEQAAARGEEIVASMRRERFPGHLGRALGNLSVALERLGRLDEALAAAREAMQRTALEDRLWVWLDVFARLAYRRGRLPAAALALGRADAARSTRGEPWHDDDSKERDALHDALRRALGDAELNHLLARGATLGDEEAARIALAG